MNEAAVSASWMAAVAAILDVNFAVNAYDDVQAVSVAQVFSTVHGGSAIVTG